MPTLPTDPSILILALALIVLLFVYFRERNLRQIIQRETDEFLESIQGQAWEDVHSSVQKSKDILGTAELEGVKVVADSKFFTQKLEAQYKDKIDKAYNNLVLFMNNLQKQGVDIKAASQKMTEERINKIFATLEQRLSDFLIQTSQKTSTSIELELKAARGLIDAYKQEQLKLIDENILAMMEQTLTIVLNKKLSLQDQLDLIYEALERAKIEKFIV